MIPGGLLIGFMVFKKLLETAFISNVRNDVKRCTEL